MINKLLNKPLEALLLLLLNKNPALKEIDIRIGGLLLLLLLSFENPSDFIDIYLYDIVDQILYNPTEYRNIKLINNLELTEQVILESLKRLSQQGILDVEHIGGELYRIRIV